MQSFGFFSDFSERHQQLLNVFVLVIQYLHTGGGIEGFTVKLEFCSNWKIQGPSDIDSKSDSALHLLYQVKYNPCNQENPSTHCTCFQPF